MPQIRFICIFATARTGSNRMLSLLANYEGFNRKGEVFHQDTIWGWSEDDRRAVVARSGVPDDDKHLCAWRASHLGETLEALYEGGERRTLVFKIFPQQLSREALCRDLFLRDDIGYVVLRRRPIESFISLVKAREINGFTHVDTTDLRPKLNAKLFIPWAMLTRDWYNWISAELGVRGLPCVDLSYEQEIGIPDAAVALSRTLAKLEKFDLPPTRLRRNKVRRFERQDREDDYRNRVENWPQFEAALLSEPAYAHLLSWAESADPVTV